MQIDILPIVGDKKLDAKIVDGLAALLRKNGLVADVMNPEKLPKSSFNKSRGQYDAMHILQRIDKRGVLAVTGEDIFENGLNFVYGLGDREGSAIVSWFRLRPEFYGEKENDASLLKRLSKEALHEIGHTLGMKHCDRMVAGRQCVMSFSTNIHEVDKKAFGFCKEHSKLLD